MHPWGYSALAPYVMAVLGVAVSGLLAAVAGAVLLARLLRDTARPYAGALAGAVFAVADVVSGRTTFALGAVAALAALVLLPRRVSAAVAAVLAALLSPVAAAFLGLAAAVLVLRRQPGGWTTGLAATVPVLAVAVAFPSGGTQPFVPSSAVWAVLAGLALAALTTSPALRLGGLLYAGACVLLVVAPGPFGSNVLRLGLLLAAPLVLATGRRPLAVVLPVAAGLALWQVQPTLADLRAPEPPPFGGLLAALEREDVVRVEVVPLRDHEEADVVAERVPLARGWSRQLDVERAGLFYEGALTPERYAGWLREQGADAVAVAPSARLDGAGLAERDLLLSGAVPGLREVPVDEHWRLWRVDAPYDVVRADRTSLAVRAPAAGEAAVPLRWSRWLSVDGPACLLRDGDRVLLRFTRAGEAVVSSSLRPGGRC